MGAKVASTSGHRLVGAQSRPSLLALGSFSLLCIRSPQTQWLKNTFLSSLCSGSGVPAQLPWVLVRTVIEALSSDSPADRCSRSLQLPGRFIRSASIVVQGFPRLLDVSELVLPLS